MEPRLAAPVHSSLWVEFAGLPGAGKSEVSHTLAALLREHFSPVFEPSYTLDHATALAPRLASKLWLAARGWAHHPRQARKWLHTLAAAGQESQRGLHSVALNWFYLVGSAQRCAAIPGIHVFDQGLLQAAWSLAYGARRSAVIAAGWRARLGSALPPRALLVLVEAEVPTIRARLERRSGATSRLERDVAAGRSLTCLARAADLFSDVADVARDLAHVLDITLLRIDGNGGRSPLANAASIADAIPALLAEPRWPCLSREIPA